MPRRLAWNGALRRVEPWDLCPCGGNHSAAVHDIYATPEERARTVGDDRERYLSAGPQGAD